MTKEFFIYDGDVKVTYQETDQIKTDIFNAIISWCKKHNCTAGEVLMQNDNCLIEAPDLLSDIIDNILKFNEHYENN